MESKEVKDVFLTTPYLVPITSSTSSENSFTGTKAVTFSPADS